ncbi:DEKNAAC105078, partial [Brettanomyces naardenensis]
MENIPNNIIYILSGIILTDGYINYHNNKNKIKHNNVYTELNSRFYLKQSVNHTQYLLYVYNKLAHYCMHLPKLRKVYIKGKRFYCIEFYTRSLPCFTLLRQLFYNGRVKIIPSDIYDYLNYESLAHMIMCDGSLLKGGGIILNLQNYTIKELILLINVFNIKFNLNCILHKSKNRNTIYIKLESVKKLYKYIEPYLIEDMKYKFNYKLIEKE